MNPLNAAAASVQMHNAALSRPAIAPTSAEKMTMNMRAIYQ
jgi:hypothetical protein